MPWWLIPIAVIIGLAVLAGTLRSETRELVAYFDTVGPLLEGQEAMSDTFGALVREDFQTIEREDFATLVGAMETDIRSAQAELDAFPTPDRAVAANALLLEALDAWISGLEAFETGVLAAADDPISPLPIDQLSQAIIQLRVGDSVYSRFLDRSTELRTDLDVEIGDFPVIAYAENEPALTSGEFVARFVRTASSLGVRSDVAILSVVFDPPATGGTTTDGADIFPETESILLQATVSNVGNQDEKGIVLRMTLLSAAGALVSELNSEQVDLPAGEATSLSFGPLAVVPGQRYRLFLDLEATPEEVLLDNNGIEMPFVVSSPG